MAGLGILLDPTAEATGTQLDIADGTTFALIAEPDFTPPGLEPQWASSSDTEGALLAATKHQNRTITVPVRVLGGTAGGFDTAIAKLQQKVGKIAREGGTLKVTMPSTKTVVFDLLDAEITTPVTKRLVTSSRADVTLKFTAKPYGRLPDQAFGSHTETTLPCLVFTETGVQGDVPGLGKLTVTNASVANADQWGVLWGVQSRHYDSAATAKLFYEAEALTPQGGSTTVAAPDGGGSGAGSNTIKNASLSTLYQSILSTQIVSGSAHMTHVGDFRVIARAFAPKTNSGDVTLCLEWASGDFQRVARNDPWRFPVNSGDMGQDAWRLADLGVVNLASPPLGTGRWEGRILAKSTNAGDDVYIDAILLIPVTEGAGEARATPSTTSPTAFSARDEFDQAAGNLNTKTLPVGGAWATSGGGSDFAVEATGHTLQRTVSGERFAVAGTTVLTATGAQVDYKTSDTSLAGTAESGILARYTDTSNYVLASVFDGGGSTSSKALYFQVKVAAAFTTTAVVDVNISENALYTIRVVIDTGGHYWVWFNQQGSGPGAPVIAGYSSDLATGGALASGKLGLYDSSTETHTRTFDNFAAWVPVADAAIFADQSIAIRHDGAYREDSTGTIYQPVSVYEGDHLLVPPAGQEGRSVRVIVKASQGDLAALPDVAIEDLTAQLTVTPRVLELPE